MTDIEKTAALAQETAASAGVPVSMVPGSPVAINPSVLPAVGGTLVGAIAIVTTGTATVLGFVSKRDLWEAITWFQGTEGVAYLAALGFVSAVAWRTISTIRKHLKLLFVGRRAPNWISFIIGEQEPSPPPVR